jgi:transcription elongation factor Elf1
MQIKNCPLCSFQMFKEFSIKIKNNIIGDSYHCMACGNHFIYKILIKEK